MFAGGTRSRSSLLLVFLGCLAPIATGCSDSTQVVRPPTLGTPVPPVVTPPTPGTPSVPTSGFPALTRGGQIYVAPISLYDVFADFHGSSLPTRYVLYDDNSFTLQFLSARFGFFEYTGYYSRLNSKITFLWNGWSTAGPWGADGILHGDSLSVTYNLIMRMTDFIDGTYVR